jgi:hypothetical protein
MLHFHSAADRNESDPSCQQQNVSERMKCILEVTARRDPWEISNTFCFKKQRIYAVYAEEKVL